MYLGGRARMGIQEGRACPRERRCAQQSMGVPEMPAGTWAGGRLDGDCEG